MQTNIFIKIKEFLKNLFKKKNNVVPTSSTSNNTDEDNEIVAGGFTMAPSQFIAQYKMKKESD